MQHAHLKPLNKRYTPAHREKRDTKMRARSAVAAQLLGQQRLRDQMLYGFVSMGLLARLRWGFFGARLTPKQGNMALMAILAFCVTVLWLAQS